MKHSIAILTMHKSNNNGEYQFAALILKPNQLPQYFLFTASQKSVGVMQEILQDTNIFVNDKTTVSLINKFLSIYLDTEEVIDLKDIITVFYPVLSGYQIEELCDHLKIKYGKRFLTPAQKEARLIWNFLRHCYQKVSKTDFSYFMKLEELTEGLKLAKLFGILRKEMMAKFPDRTIRTGVYEKDFEGLFELASETTEDEDVFISSSWVVNCFKPGGVLSLGLPRYEDRCEQMKMAEGVMQSLESSRDIVIEAGTGTGKSIAYLIPALWWAKKHKKRVIVATHTINLQEQLYQKDLPFLKSLLPFNFKTALLKGKGNYLCLRSFLQERLKIEKTTEQEKLAHAGMFTWTRETLTGDLGELPSASLYNFIWRRYRADQASCMPGDCSFAKQCFFLRARRKADEADLIVINHALLIADIKTNYKTLPEYGDLVIDEAHHLHQTALKQLGFELSFEQVLRQIDNIGSGRSSLLYQLKNNRSALNKFYPSINWAEIDSYISELPLYFEKIVEQSQALFELFKGMLGDRINLRIDKEALAKDVYQIYLISIENLASRLKDIVNILEKINLCFVNDSQQQDAIKYDIVMNKSELTQILEGLNLIYNSNDCDYVTYLEKSGIIYLKHTTIDIAGILRDKIFAKNNCTILTSATLSVTNNFSIFARDIGLQDYQSLKLNSPFAYDKQMRFCIVNDLPLQHLSEEVLASKTASFIQQAAELMQGRTMVLFTSYRYLRLVREKLRLEFKNTPFRVLGQGIDGSREDILKKFTEEKDSVLLGTNSFWEGIDLPGEALRCVIMTKIPFSPPDTPILEARSRSLQRQGKDPFRELHLPEAIIRFKQGFGRLIRTKEDKGVVIILDDRLLKKYYGIHFLKSLPIRTYYQGNSEDIIKEVLHWV